MAIAFSQACCFGNRTSGSRTEMNSSLMLSTLGLLLLRTSPRGHCTWLLGKRTAHCSCLAVAGLGFAKAAGPLTLRVGLECLKIFLSHPGSETPPSHTAGGRGGSGGLRARVVRRLLQKHKPGRTNAWIHQALRIFGVHGIITNIPYVILIAKFFRNYPVQ